MTGSGIRGLLRVDKAIGVGELWTITVALAVMLVCVMLGVIDRTFALPWPDLSEIALMSMAVIAFIGGAYAVHINGHISVDVLQVTASPKLRRALGILVGISIVAFSIALIAFAGPFLLYVMRMSERTPELELPIAFPVGCLVAGSVLSVFHVVSRTLSAAINKVPA